MMTRYTMTRSPVEAPELSLTLRPDDKQTAAGQPWASSWTMEVEWTLGSAFGNPHTSICCFANLILSQITMEAVREECELQAGKRHGEINPIAKVRCVKVSSMVSSWFH